jgi:hypothetical protein
MPEAFSSSSCVICGQSEETVEHLLYQCPLKLAVWQTIWEEHFPAAALSPMVVHNALFRLRFPQKHTQAPSVPTSAIIAAIITSIWRAHWSTVFDAQPFLVNQFCKVCASSYTRHTMKLFSPQNKHIGLYLLFVLIK